MGYYPIYLDLQGRSCVMIGSGHEVDRKVQDLIAGGAHVTCITPHPSPFMEKAAAAEQITLQRRDYQAGDLAGVFLAIAATTRDRALSERIATEARVEKVLLNVMDVTDLCVWIAPAIVRRGDLSVAISTSGRSPAMARFVKNEIEAALSPEHEALLDIVADVRSELRRRKVSVDAEAWQHVLESRVLEERLDVGDREGARALLLSALTSQHRPSAEGHRG